MLKVVDWDDNFENNRTRELINMRWVPFKNTFDSDGYIELIEDHENGMAHFGAWILMVEVASTCEPRGLLIRKNGSAHTPPTLARKTRGNLQIFNEAIPRLISIGWLEDTAPQETARKSHPTDYGRKEGKEGRKEKKSRTFVPPSVDAVFKYCAERKNTIDAQYWHDFYTSKDWMVGKNKMKDWKAAVRTWERNSGNRAGGIQMKSGPKLQDLT